MANVINSLLVGIGFQVDQKSADNVSNSIDTIQSKALQLGGLVAGAFGANALTFGFAQTYDELGKFGERWGIAAESVVAYDRALQHAGGTTGEFYGTVQRLTQLQSQSAQGRAGMIAALAPEGISDQVASVINASNALEGFLAASDAINQLDAARQERFIQALGFTDAEVRLLHSGRDAILSAVDAERKLRPVTSDMTKAAADFNDQWQDLTSNVGGFSDRIATPLVAGISSILTSTNEWIGANRELINSFSEFAGETLGDNIEIIAVALGGLSAAGVIAGLKSVATLVAGISASLVTGAAAAGPWVAAATALYAVATEGGQGGRFSAGGIFGDNAVTRFLDTPISELFSSGSPTPVSSYIQQQAGQTPIQIQNQIILDGQVIDDRVNTVIGEQAEQAIQDLSNSEGG